MLGSNYDFMFHVITSSKNSLSFHHKVSLHRFTVKYTLLKEPEQKLEAQGCLGTDLALVSTSTSLLFIHIVKTAIGMKATLMKKELRNEIIKYN